MSLGLRRDSRAGAPLYQSHTQYPSDPSDLCQLRGVGVWVKDSKTEASGRETYERNPGPRRSRGGSTALSLGSFGEGSCGGVVGVQRGMVTGVPGVGQGPWSTSPSRHLPWGVWVSARAVQKVQTVRLWCRLFL